MKWTINKDFRKLAVILAAAAVLSFGIERALAVLFYQNDSFFWGRYAVVFVTLELTACLVCFRDMIARKVEVAVLVVILSLGTLYATVLPAACGISWDDEWHYYCSMNMSHVLEPVISEGEYYCSHRAIYLKTALEHKNYDRRSQKKTYHKIDKLHEEKREMLTERFWPRYRNICYMPSAIGLWIGRHISLPYHMTFKLGRWFNMLFYAVIVFLAIRKLKSGKVLAAAIALIPFNIFMASSYSYDQWLTMWLLYGFCCFFGELQQPDKKMTAWEWICMLFAFFIGVGPKILYIPLVLLTLFLPKEKFVSPRQRKFMIAAALCVFAVVSVRLLFLFATPGGEAIQDSRGGKDVDAFGQISYIFSHPWEYTKILLKFLTEYVSLKSANRFFAYLQYFTELQPTIFSPLAVATLGVVTFTDKDDHDLNVTWVPRVVTYVLSFGVLCLVATSMYIAFTPVGSNVIKGCQYRYIAPLLFPVLYSLGSAKLLNKVKGKLKLEIKREYYNGIVLAIYAFISIHAVWVYAVNLY